MKYNESGWLFQSGKMRQVVETVSEKDLLDLVEQAKEEDEWGERVRKEVELRDKDTAFHPGDYILDTIRLYNTSGTVVTHPYGDILTFSSSRHLYRGEVSEHEKTIPSMNRKLEGKSLKDKEAYRILENMRLQQFSNFLWKIPIIPFWEATLCDLNIVALAQHYGFKTHLLDLTNDFRNALFFATCKYDWITDSYRPLNAEDIGKSEKSQYGVIFHTPDWMVDFHQPQGIMNLSQELMALEQKADFIEIDSGILDGTAFQIGFQPLLRCHSQSGYVLPMRDDAPLQKDMRFEKLRFRQTPEFSRKVFDMMEGGKKVYPFEGISKARDIIRRIQGSMVFSEEDLEAAYERSHVDKSIFPMLDDARTALGMIHEGDKKVEIVKKEVEYNISCELLNEISSAYSVDDIYDRIGKTMHMTGPQRKRREEVCKAIYGKVL